jgi:GH43 family beta-xylosidase
MKIQFRYSAACYFTVSILIIWFVLSGCVGYKSRYADEAPGQGYAGSHGNGWDGPHQGLGKTVKYSFDNINRVAKFTIDGPQRNYWDASMQWNFTAEKRYRYLFEFEAWTDRGNMILNAFSSSDQFTPVQVDTQHKRYIWEATQKAKNINDYLCFQFGSQKGTVNIRILSIRPIKETEPGPGEFRNPIQSAGDPYMIYADGWYYFTYFHGAVQSIFRSKTLNNWEENNKRKLITGTDGKQVGPGVGEFHFIDGKWWLYGCGASEGKPKVPAVAWEGGSDLWNSNWVYHDMGFPEGKYVGDQTIVKINGQWYFVYTSFEPEDSKNWNLYIDRMITPYQLEQKPEIISRPTFDWERDGSGRLWALDEGACAVYTDNYTGLLFSGNGYDSSGYCLGYMHIKNGLDPKDINNWEKIDHPLLEQAPELGIYGPGHNSVFTSPDGKERWICYHAWLSPPEEGIGYRRTFCMPFTLDENEIPVFGKPLKAGSIIKLPSGDPGGKKR